MILRLRESPDLGVGQSFYKYTARNETFLEGVIRAANDDTLEVDFGDYVLAYPTSRVARYQTTDGSVWDFTSSPEPGIIVEDHRREVKSGHGPSGGIR